MGTFSITRDIMIAAPRERVYALVDDLREWERWSPWEVLAPSMSHEYTGPDRGVGARHCWVGNKDAGEGEMLITDSSPDGVSLDLHFVKPSARRTPCASASRRSTQARGRSGR